MQNNQIKKKSHNSLFLNNQIYLLIKSLKLKTNKEMLSNIE